MKMFIITDFKYSLHLTIAMKQDSYVYLIIEEAGSQTCSLQSSDPPTSAPDTLCATF